MKWCTFLCTTLYVQYALPPKLLSRFCWNFAQRWRSVPDTGSEMEVSPRQWISRFGDTDPGVPPGSRKCTMGEKMYRVRLSFAVMMVTLMMIMFMMITIMIK